MFLGVPRQMYLTRARDSFLLDCQAANFDSQILQGYRDILNNFIAYTGDILVRELVPDDLQLYIVDLADVCEIGQPDLVEEHYGVLSEWIHWMYIQREITEPVSGQIEPPRLSTRSFFTPTTFREINIVNQSIQGNRLQMGRLCRHGATATLRRATPSSQ